MQALAAVLCAVFLTVATAGESDVVELVESNFADEIAKNKLTLVEFYAPWCGHCKAFAPEYDAASLRLKNLGFADGKLAKVDCTTHRGLCDQHRVMGFPTVKLFRNDKSEPMEYDGARTSDDLVRFMTKQNQPVITELAGEADVAKFALGENVKVVGFFEAASNGAFEKVASVMKHDFSFAAIRSNAKLGTFVRLYRAFDEPTVEYKGEMTEDGISSFVTQNSFPLVGAIGPENYDKYLERGLHFVWVFMDFDSVEQKELVRTVVTTVARENRQLSFVKLDGVKWSEHAKNMGLPGTTPGIVIEERDPHSSRKGKNFIFSEDLTFKNFKAFIEKYQSKTLQPHMKSEAIPTKNQEAVKVVVAYTFDSIVMDDKRDVLVEFFAPWCGHCKQLTPKYSELGKRFVNEHQIVIAKIDATANDSPIEIEGFPTIYFYPAGDKAHPLRYDGDRSVEDMEKFVRSHAKAKPGSVPALQLDVAQEPAAVSHEL